jgi:hypothetical protein
MTFWMENIEDVKNSKDLKKNLKKINRTPDQSPDAHSKMITFYYDLSNILQGKVNEKNSEIAELWLTLQRIRAICKIYENTGIDSNGVRHISELAKRHH